MANDLTQSQLKSLLSYDPDTGIFIRVVDRRGYLAGTQAGGLNNCGYISLKVCGRRYGAHRLAWLYVYGYLPKMLDHINRVRSDNRIVNLRETSRILNPQNRNLNRNNTSGSNGVHRRSEGTWRARLTVNSCRISLGDYRSREEATDAHDRAKEKFHTFNPKLLH